MRRKFLGLTPFAIKRIIGLALPAWLFLFATGLAQETQPSIFGLSLRYSQVAFTNDPSGFIYAGVWGASPERPLLLKNTFVRGDFELGVGVNGSGQTNFAGSFHTLFSVRVPLPEVTPYLGFGVGLGFDRVGLGNALERFSNSGLEGILVAALAMFYVFHFEAVLGLDWEWDDQRAVLEVVVTAGGFSNLGFGLRGAFYVPEVSVQGSK